MASSDLPVMNRSSPLNPPVQVSVPATPETRHDPMGVPAPSETQPNRPPIGYRQGGGRPPLNPDD